MSARSPEAAGVAGRRSSAVHGLDPRAKLIAIAGVTVTAVSAPLAAWPTFVACARGARGDRGFAARVPARVVWRRARIVLLPVLLVALTVPFVRPGGAAAGIGPLTAHEHGAEVALLVALKAIVGTVGAVLLGATTTVPDMLHGLERLRVPRLFVLIAGLMHRYVFVLAAEARAMRAALAARCWQPRSVAHAGAAGRVAGALFVRGHARGERVHRAMLARGFDGSVPRRAALSLGRADVSSPSSCSALVVAARAIGGPAA